MITDWNKKNPELSIEIKPGSILHRVRQMRSTAQDRMIKSSPKVMREEVRAAFATE